jgi:hypothetical protein
MSVSMAAIGWPPRWTPPVLAYRQRDNCFVWVEDAPRAQALLAEQLRTDWRQVLGRLLDAEKKDTDCTKFHEC